MRSDRSRSRPTQLQATRRADRRSEAPSPIAIREARRIHAGYQTRRKGGEVNPVPRRREARRSVTSAGTMRPQRCYGCEAWRMQIQSHPDHGRERPPRARTAASSALAAEPSGPAGRAVVRSERAAGSGRERSPEVEPPRDRASSTTPMPTPSPAPPRAATSCSAIVHLVGIIKEAAGTSTYARGAREGQPPRARVEAATRAGRPAHRLPERSSAPRQSSNNACLASKGRRRADPARKEACRRSVLRVPMVLGRGRRTQLARAAGPAPGRASCTARGRGADAAWSSQSTREDVVSAIDSAPWSGRQPRGRGARPRPGPSRSVGPGAGGAGRRGSWEGARTKGAAGAALARARRGFADLRGASALEPAPHARHARGPAPRTTTASTPAAACRAARHRAHTPRRHARARAASTSRRPDERTRDRRQLTRVTARPRPRPKLWQRAPALARSRSSASPTSTVQIDRPRGAHRRSVGAIPFLLSHRSPACSWGAVARC